MSVRGDDAHADPRRAADDGAEELLAVGRGDLLRVVQERQRTHAVVAQAVVVEQHAGDHERPCQRASPGLVGARDEARAELPIVGEELLTRWSAARLRL